MDADVRLRLSAQRALLTHITPSMRAVSVEVRPTDRAAWMRFVFDGEPSPDAREVASCAHTEVLSDFSDSWSVELELVARPAPDRMEHRRWLVYHRCEDSWVQDARPSVADSRVQAALRHGVLALKRVANCVLPAALDRRLQELGDNKEHLDTAQHEELLALMKFNHERTHEKLQAELALRELQVLVPDDGQP